MKILGFLALLLIAILIALYLVTHAKKPEVPREPEKVTAPEQKIPVPKSPAKEQSKSATDANYLDALEQEILSQVNLESGELYKVSIKGYVYDAKSQPLKDARVSLEMDNTDIFEGTVFYTDENGFFEISGEFLKGKYTLSIQHLKYKNAREFIEINSNCEETKYIMLENYGR